MTPKEWNPTPTLIVIAKKTKRYCKTLQIFEGGLHDHLTESSTILIGKNTLRSDKSWWLPIFRTLCIQGQVKETVFRHMRKLGATRDRIRAANHYIQAALQLFAAVSSIFDSLRNESAQPDVSWLKNAVYHRHWLAKDIRSSSQYLGILHSLEMIYTVNDIVNTSPLTEWLLKSTTCLGLALPT